ncbi:sugar transferase [Wenxinia marina]|uniref:Sugar transferase involved in lipopolysaccharide synthesis n=1 Tax=Wenxinia marina DSM 24838 TaxID=1123501 RepID=A0A0D0Q9S9_9RHOB|nr:sugar transferase [Wenxinia marina]KIQ67773.1 Sugar transferase involved in lipopolysaccharide synthesis [Wenxinia marina DSM 24838]GGL77354.1 exopolysaccharide biosynthesis protein [Wenxinia marina]
MTEAAVNGRTGVPVPPPCARDAWSGRAKRTFDLVLCLMLCLPIALLVAALFLLARLDGGPGFFGHRRVGRDGREFVCWKIRTMVPDAEARLTDYLAENPDARMEWARDFKLTDDPRVTRIGRVLRETSLDELPQIWNVLRGDMSFVGPRPVTAAELDRYRGCEACYLSHRPGMTGLWQISGRNDLDYGSRIRLDMEYSHSHGLVQDVRIILRTCGAVLARTGR